MEKAAIPKGPKYPLANIFIKIRKEMRNRIKLGLDLFQMEQLDHILREIEENPDLQHRLIMDSQAYNEIL